MILGWRCPVCGAQGQVPCAACAAAMRPAGRVQIGGVEAAAALLSYRGAARELVARLKYRNARASVAWLAGGMAQLAGAWHVDVVTWAPASPRHARRRGFDHGELLARGVGRHLGVSVAALLRRDRGVAQTGRSAAERLAGPPLRARALLHGETVLVVDDVITTGATLGTAARLLRSIGASSVFAVAAAYTPAPTFGPTAATA